MSNLDDIFSLLFDELISATEKQRELHTSAFGKSNSQEIIAKAEHNRQQLDCWYGLLQELKSEMTESGLFVSDKHTPAHRRSGASKRIDTDAYSPDTKPVCVTVLEQYKPVRYWKDILLFVCKTLYEKQPYRYTGIENEPTLQGRNNPYISIDKKQLRKPEKIEGSPYFVEINLNQAYCKKIAYLMLAFFGYTQSDMVIEEKSKNLSGQTD